MSLYDIKVKNRKGEEVSLADFKEKVLLIVNTATGCGFTPQYEGLEKLYKKYKDKGFEILDFPLNGENASPLYKFLKEKQPEDAIEGFFSKFAMKFTTILSSSCKEPQDIKWNFTKFLVDKEGNVIGRYPPTCKPENIESKIKELLNVTEDDKVPAEADKTEEKKDTPAETTNN
ncbi:hypothetical protein PIROE2DRAFT_13852 [Piromyces sp. E2]|nr:hypothetical protein PIROE2DRAFT_13852 [Piromyces sp. E2]|eukprot:OUM60384.1 hypothetical protein PIROE2DRAFT_13852 [Piromyces sp. E2]